jgi:hypothetical protein
MCYYCYPDKWIVAKLGEWLSSTWRGNERGTNLKFLYNSYEFCGVILKFSQFISKNRHLYCISLYLWGHAIIYV